MYCTHCGGQISEDALFCPSCGKSRIENPVNPQQAAKYMPIKEEQEVSLNMTPQQLSGRYAKAHNISEHMPQESVPKKRKMPRWLLISICAGAVLLFALIVIILLNPEDFRRHDKDGVLSNAETDTSKDVGALFGSDNASSDEVSMPTEDYLLQAHADMQIKEGECLYTGSCSYMDLDKLEISFILSADKSYIHGMSFIITNLTASISNGNATTSVTISESSQYYPGQYPVDIENGTAEITIGASKILNLYFYEQTASLELDFTYIYNGTGMNAQQTEIPFGINYVELMTEDDLGSYPPPAEEPKTEPELELESELESEPEPEAEPELESEPEPELEPEPESELEAESEQEETETVFDENILINWNSEALQSAFDVYDIYSFTPDNPVPKYYIVCSEGVYDPVTDRESEGGHTRSYARHLPISTQDMLRTSGELRNGGLTLTDDPNLATYALILNYSYINNIGTFHFSEDDTYIPQYHATLDSELYNLVTGESIYSETINGYATYANETVYTSMLDAAKGNQLYGGTIYLHAEDFNDYWSFINK